MFVHHRAPARLVAALLAATVLMACGGGSDEESATDEESASEESATDEESASEESASDEEAPGGTEETSAPADGSAVLTLDNGERYEFDPLCTLEPQIAAGSEILFTATSFGDPALDITQFGDDGTVTGIASVTVFDGTDFEALWGASSFYEAFGGELELTLDGRTIRGVGTFYAGDDPTLDAEGVPGEVIANC